MPTYECITNQTVYTENRYGDRVKITRGETIETYQQIPPKNRPDLFKRISDEPYYPLALTSQIITFNETGVTKSVGGLLETGIVRVSTDIEITIMANSENNPYGYRLRPVDGVIDLKNTNNIESLYITSHDVGQVIVQGLDK